jgi:hypothetical protein
MVLSKGQLAHDPGGSFNLHRRLTATSVHYSIEISSSRIKLVYSVTCCGWISSPLIVTIVPWTSFVNDQQWIHSVAHRQEINFPLSLVSGPNTRWRAYVCKDQWRLWRRGSLLHQRHLGISVGDVVHKVEQRSIRRRHRPTRPRITLMSDFRSASQ